MVTVAAKWLGLVLVCAAAGCSSSVSVRGDDAGQPADAAPARDASSLDAIAVDANDAAAADAADAAELPDAPSADAGPDASAVDVDCGAAAIYHPCQLIGSIWICTSGQAVCLSAAGNGVVGCEISSTQCACPQSGGPPTGCITP